MFSWDIINIYLYLKKLNVVWIFSRKKKTPNIISTNGLETSMTYTYGAIYKYLILCSLLEKTIMLLYKCHVAVWHDTHINII